jgi:hypothetical protein
MQLTNLIKTQRIKPDGSGFGVAAGTSDLTSDVIDTAGYEGVRILLGFGVITTGALTSAKVAQCDTSGGSYADLEGTKVTVADDDDSQVVVIDIHRPRERYLEVLIDRGTQNAVVDFCIVEYYGSSTIPAANSDATVVATELHVSPAEGTA